MDDNIINENVELDENLERSMSECYTDLLSQIKRREAELFLWQILIDKITGNANPFMNMNTFAVMFFGEKIFSMNKQEVSESIEINEKNPKKDHLISISIFVFKDHTRKIVVE